ncbi:MAG: TIGR02452 family protein [Bacteroidota bacterium]
MKRPKRIAIALDTISVLKKGSYTNGYGETINLKADQSAAEKGTKLFSPEALIKLTEGPFPEGKKYETEFQVNGLTTLDSVRNEVKDGGKLLCLNFASAKKPGGGFLNGAVAQEESIARASGLYPCLLEAQAYYDINRSTKTALYTDYMIYSPGVPIFKYEEGEPMDNYILASVITAPAVNAGVVIGREPENVDMIEPIMERRIDMVLAICRSYGYETLILGAWGCGVFRNDPVTIAGMFSEKLRGKYEGAFKKVVFSIYSRDQRYITPFKHHFG